jgi:hypothetical protein
MTWDSVYGGDVEEKGDVVARDVGCAVGKVDGSSVGDATTMVGSPDGVLDWTNDGVTVSVRTNDGSLVGTADGDRVIRLRRFGLLVIMTGGSVGCADGDGVLLW